MKVDPQCVCGSPESLIHLFTDCPLIQYALRWVLSIIQIYDSSKIALSKEEMLFGFSQTTRIPKAYTALLSITRHNVWLQRNLYTFENKVPDIRQIITKSKNTFRFLVRTQAKHCGLFNFTEQWLADGAIGNMDCINVVQFVDILV